MAMRMPKGKVLFLVVIVVAYAIAFFVLRALVRDGTIDQLPPTPESEGGADSLPPAPSDDVEDSLRAAQDLITERFVRDGGHVDLYRTVSPNATFAQDLGTNSEAVSYYLLWIAQDGRREEFDLALDFMEERMLHPSTGHMRWRLTANDTVEGDGENIASDADLRAIKALLIAEERWGDERYGRLIARLATGLETTAVTKDGYLAPYGGASGESSGWVADEVWLSYEDFVVIDALAQRRGEPWGTMYAKMKNATLSAQIHNGLYNSQLTQQRQYGNGIDGGGYSINSLWIMVRAAESDDPELRESAARSLAFYKQKYEVDAQIYPVYGSNGDALSPSDTPWAYALVGRAAAALGDDAFADAMMRELIRQQIDDPGSAWHGAFPEGEEGNVRVGQFTMQESILAMQEYLGRFA